MSAEGILVFGGSFDPPHLGHMALLQGAIAAVHPARVLVMPSGTAPHKQASTTPGPLRAAMCACFLPVFPHLEVSRMELERPGRSYTVDTLTRLRDDNPGVPLYLTVGGDMLLSFADWVRYQDILQMATLVAQSRGEAPLPQLEAAADALRRQGGRVLFAESPVVPASSSAIRQAVEDGRDISQLVPPLVAQMIEEYGLYRKPET